MRYALGIDGGGSKCDAVLVAETGAVAGWGRGGPTHVYYDSPEVVAASYREAIASALAGVVAAECWTAGYLPEGRFREVFPATGEAVHYLVTNEVETAFASAQEQWGLVVLSGTGSFVHSRRPDGRHLHWGGLGPVLNDYGSAYEIGLRGLRAAFASGWTESRRTSLAAALPRALGVADLRGVFRLVYVENMGRRQIAALARAVDREAEAGDRVAVECVRQSARELAGLAADQIGELGMRDLAIPVVPIGGVAQGSRIWWDEMRCRLAEAAPEMRPVWPRVQPAEGAALLALRQMGVDWEPGLVGRLVETGRAFRPSREG
jgi:N-acetylglucosamine kinase-like BadF-type ATPase